MEKFLGQLRLFSIPNAHLSTGKENPVVIKKKKKNQKDEVFHKPEDTLRNKGDIVQLPKNCLQNNKSSMARHLC